MHEVRLLNYGNDAEVEDPCRSLSSKMWKKYIFMDLWLASETEKWKCIYKICMRNNSVKILTFLLLMAPFWNSTTFLRFKTPPIISWMTQSKMNRLHTIQYNTKFVKRHVAVASEALFGMYWNLRIFKENFTLLQICPSYLYNIATVPWKIRKVIFQQYRLQPGRSRGGGREIGFVCTDGGLACPAACTCSYRGGAGALQSVCDC